MKSKVLSLFGLGILALIVFTSLVSAAITFTNVPTLSRNGTSATINISSTINETLNFTLTTITESGKTITFSPISDLVISDAPAPHTLTLTYFIQDDFDFRLGKTYSTILTATGTTSPAVPQTISFEVSDPSNYIEDVADDGKLDISIDDITVEKGFGDDNEWYPLDEISAKINVENNYGDSDNKIRNIYVKWGLYDQNTGKWVIGIEKETKFSLDGGEDKTLTVNFKLDSPDDFQDHEDDNYLFYAWATGDNEVTDNSTSTTASESVDLGIESDFVVLNDIKLPETAACGSEVQITADVWNIGDSDQQDVYVQIINTKLGINKEVSIGDIDAFEKAALDFTFTIPTDLEEGNFPIKLIVYNEDDEVYSSSNDDDSIVTSTLNIQEACVFNPKLAITAVIESGGKAGQELVVKTTVKNTDTKTRTFTVNAADYASWAELVETSPEQIALDAGETGEITVTLNVNKNVEGEQSFSVEFVEGNKVIPQLVTVTVEKTGLFSFLTGNVIQGNNWYLWAIGGLNILLVLMIVLVAVRVARKK